MFETAIETFLLLSAAAFVYGFITIKTAVPFARRWGAIRERYDLRWMPTERFQCRLSLVTGYCTLSIGALAFLTACVLAVCW